MTRWIPKTHIRLGYTDTHTHTSWVVHTSTVAFREGEELEIYGHAGVFTHTHTHSCSTHWRQFKQKFNILVVKLFGTWNKTNNLPPLTLSLTPPTPRKTAWNKCKVGKCKTFEAAQTATPATATATPTEAAHAVEKPQNFNCFAAAIPTASTAPHQPHPSPMTGWPNVVK